LHGLGFKFNEVAWTEFSLCWKTTLCVLWTVHFTTKRNMSVNLKIGFNNNFITNSSYTKFLGVTMNNILSWNNYIDLLMKKLSKVCYIIKNAKTYVSASSLKVIYYAFFFTRL